MFKSAGSWVYKHFTPLQPYIRSAYIRFFSRLNFMGWGMSTEHEVPWIDEYDWENFRSACKKVKHHFELTPNAPSSPVNTDDLMWRHWIVSFAVRKAIRFTISDQYHFVECGVGDGLTSFFILSEMANQKILSKSTLHLYDSWQAMESNRLNESEQMLHRNYQNLNLERTKRNLSEFDTKVIYHVGYVPDTFLVNAPESIIFLHIDLNSSRPTLDTLEFFFPRLRHNGIILFDDYGFSEYRETKKLVDKFFSDKDGVLEKLATGQAIYHHFIKNEISKT